MNKEAVNQIIEVVKTLNLNVDSKTLVEVVSQVKLIFYAFLIKDFVLQVLGFIVFLVAIYIISKAVMGYWRKDKKKSRVIRPLE